MHECDNLWHKLCLKPLLSLPLSWFQSSSLRVNCCSRPMPVSLPIMNQAPRGCQQSDNQPRQKLSRQASLIKAFPATAGKAQQASLSGGTSYQTKSGFLEQGTQVWPEMLCAHRCWEMLVSHVLFLSTSHSRVSCVVSAANGQCSADVR